VTIVNGDSTTQLEPILREVSAPAVLWLDGHYSGMHTARGVEGDTPILRELDVALREGKPDDAILIDDARLFGIDPAYPTVETIERFVSDARPWCIVVVDDDIIQIYPHEMP